MINNFYLIFLSYDKNLESFVEALEKDFDNLTAIQSVSWPVVMSGHDAISIGRTGSGKTLAFILPALIHTLHQKPKRMGGEGPSVLVLCPTRELAQQVEQVATSFRFYIFYNCKYII